MKRELKKEQTRIRIKEAALSLLAEQGYETTTIEQIAKLSGIAKGTFFNYFASKDELICDLQGVFVMNEITKLKDKPGPLIQRFKMVFFSLVHKFPRNKSVFRGLFQAVGGSGPALERRNKLTGEFMEVLIANSAGAGERGAAQGHASGDDRSACAPDLLRRTYRVVNGRSQRIDCRPNGAYL